MGAFENLGRVLGEYQRGYRILAAFSPTGRADALAKSLLGRRRSLLGNELCLYARRLGRLEDAREIMQTVATWPEVSANPEDRCGFYKNRSDVTFRLGYLAEALRLADAAVEIATRELNQTEQYGAFACRARVAHATASGKASRTKIDREAIGLLADRLHARRLIDLGELTSARAVCGSELEHCQAAGDNIGEASGHVLLARIDVLEGKDPAPHLDRVRAWTVRTGDMELIIEARLISARYLLAQGDLQNALCEAEAGLLHAVSCGYRLLRIELLIAIARIRLTWPDPAKAVQSAREALDLAAVSECGYLWGEADAAQVWGEAYLANHEPMLAQRALRRALEARVRVQHPDISQTRQWLARARGG
jgi:tetratricopeptide (TPR) repeat protein